MRPATPRQTSLARCQLFVSLLPDKHPFLIPDRNSRAAPSSLCEVVALIDSQDGITIVTSLARLSECSAGVARTGVQTSVVSIDLGVWRRLGKRDAESPSHTSSSIQLCRMRKQFVLRNSA